MAKLRTVKSATFVYHAVVLEDEETGRFLLMETLGDGRSRISDWPAPNADTEALGILDMYLRDCNEAVCFKEQEAVIGRLPEVWHYLGTDRDLFIDRNLDF